MERLATILRSVRVGTRLALGFAVVLLVLCAVFAMVLTSVLQGQRRVEDVRQSMQERSAVLHDLSTAQLTMVSVIRNAGLQQDAAAVNADVDTATKLMTAAKQSEQKLQASSVLPREKELLVAIQKSREQAQALAKEAADLTLSFSGDVAAKLLTGKFALVNQGWAAQIAQLESFYDQQAREEVLASQSASSRGLKLGLILGALTLGAAMAATIVLTRSVTVPLQSATNFAQRAAAGDLSAAVVPSGNDELTVLASSLDRMGTRLGQLIRAVQEGAQSVEHVSSTFARDGSALSDRTSRQAANLEETAAAMEQISVTAANNAVSLGRANELAAVAKEDASKSEAVIHAVLESIQEISQRSQRVGEVVNVVNQLAFQVNVLSLNAAVEAARAGNHGRGFAVVASEVRTLAQRSAAAAQEIKELIESSAQSVEVGQTRAKGAGDAIASVVSSVNRVRALVDEVTRAIDEQSQGIAQINQAISDLDRGTQDNAALVERTATASVQLSEQAQSLARSTSAFTVQSA